MLGSVGSASAVTEHGTVSTSGYDGKVYHGTQCLPTSTSPQYVLAQNDGLLTAVTAASPTNTVICPIIKDDWQSPAGLSYAKISFLPAYGIAGVSCTLLLAQINGAAMSWTNGVAGFNTIYFSPYPGTHTAEGIYAIQCSMPLGLRKITGYTVQEI